MLEAEQVPPWSAGGPVVQEECDETIMANLLSGKYSGRIPQAGHGEFYAGLSGLAVVAACLVPGPRVRSDLIGIGASRMVST